MSHPCPISPDGHVGTELEIEPTRLNFCKWSPALHVLSWVPTGDLFSLFVHLTIYLKYTLRLLSVHSLLSALHYTHLTQHIRYTILYLLVFFLKINLEHIRKSYVFFFFFFERVISLFVSIFFVVINLFVSI